MKSTDITSIQDGNKVKIITLNETTKQLLREYITEERLLFSLYLFSNAQGQLGTKHLNSVLKEHFILKDIDKVINLGHVVRLKAERRKI